MYSVVLMMALTTGGDSAALGHRSSCCGQVSSCCGRQHLGHRHSVAARGLFDLLDLRRGHRLFNVRSRQAGFCTSGSCGLALADTGSALIFVSLPADAKLTIDGEATTSTSDRRVFLSSNLPTGQEFHYTLKAEVVVNGKSVEVSKVVTVRAGKKPMSPWPPRPPWPSANPFGPIVIENRCACNRRAVPIQEPPSFASQKENQASGKVHPRRRDRSTQNATPQACSRSASRSG